MKSSLHISLFTTLFAAVLAVGCASKAPSPAETAPPAAAASQVPAPVKVAKQRIVVTKVPVLVKEASFYSDGLADENIVYKLDATMKNLLEKDTFDSSRTDPVQRLVAEYTNGLEAAESIYESDGKLRSHRELSYDSAGRVVSERSLDAKGKVLSSSTYSYDEKGRKLEWRALNASGSVKAVTSYTYGTEGPSGVEMKDAGGKVTGTIRMEYDGARLAKRSYFGADGALQKYEAYTYHGDLLSAIEYHRGDGSLVSKTAYAYGPMGELAKATEYDASGGAGAYSTYEYVVREDSATETYYE